MQYLDNVKKNNSQQIYSTAKSIINEYLTDTEEAEAVISTIIDIVNGDKDVDKAVYDMVYSNGKSVANKYLINKGVAIAGDTLSDYSSGFIKVLTGSYVPVEVIKSVTDIGKILSAYGNGEITTQKCIIELRKNSIIKESIVKLPLPVSALFQTVGDFVGSVAFRQIEDYINYLLRYEENQKERERIIKEYNLITARERELQRRLEQNMKLHFREYRQCFDESLSKIYESFRSGDADGVIKGANQITRKMGGNIRYDSVDEFIDFLNSDETDVL